MKIYILGTDALGGDTADDANAEMDAAQQGADTSSDDSSAITTSDDGGGGDDGGADGGGVPPDGGDGGGDGGDDAANAEMDAAEAAAAQGGPDDGGGDDGGGGGGGGGDSGFGAGGGVPVPAPAVAPLGSALTGPPPVQSAVNRPVTALRIPSRLLAANAPPGLKFFGAPAPQTPGGIYVPPPPPHGGAAAPAPSGGGVRIPSRVMSSAGRTSAQRGLMTRVHGDALSFVLPSQLPKVSDDAWTKFVVAMRSSPSVGSVSASNALGMWEMKPRRLADLGLVMGLEHTRDPKSGRLIWVGDFVPPLTAKKFLNDPALQYRVFAASMKRYVAGMQDKSIPVPDGGRPADMTLSGALAVLHRCGPSGLKSWNDESRRFEETRALYDRVNGIF